VIGTFQTSDGLTLTYEDEDEGQGPSVICLPGLTRNARDFDDMARALGPGQRLIRLTYRGRGASDWDENFMNYAVPVEARDVVELMDTLGLPKATLIGTSRGGIIAMLMAATVKDRLQAVLLNDIGPVIEPVGLDVIKDYIARPPAGRRYDDVAEALAQTQAKAFPGVSKDRWRTCAERWFRETDDGMALRYDPRLRDAVLAAEQGPTPDLWPLFDALDGIPTAVLRGRNSDLLSPRTLTEMTRRRPDLIAAEVPDRGHVPFLDEDISIATIRTLLKVAR